MLKANPHTCAFKKALFFVACLTTCFINSPPSISACALGLPGSISISPHACQPPVSPGTTAFPFLVPSSPGESYECWLFFGPLKSSCWLWLNIGLSQSPISQLKDQLISAWSGWYERCMHVLYQLYFFWECLKLKSILLKKIKSAYLN